MLDEKDLRAIAKLLEPLQNDIEEIKENLEELKEAQEETRTGVNALIEWAEDVSNAIRFPLPKLK